jgi:hypothetical protein
MSECECGSREVFDYVKGFPTYELTRFRVLQFSGTFNPPMIGMSRGSQVSVRCSSKGCASGSKRSESFRSHALSSIATCGAIVSRFPYLVFCVIQPTRVTVLAVLHHSRSPASWPRP